MTENVTIVYFIKRKLAINMQIFLVAKVSGGSYCNRDANSGTEIAAAKLIFT